MTRLPLLEVLDAPHVEFAGRTYSGPVKNWRDVSCDRCSTPVGMKAWCYSAGADRLCVPCSARLMFAAKMNRGPRLAWVVGGILAVAAAVGAAAWIL